MNLLIFNNFSWTNSSGWIMLLIFLGVALIYGLSMGRNRLMIMILGTYFSYILVRAVPWKELTFLGIKEAPSSAVQTFIFLALILGFYFLIPHSAFHSVLRLRRRHSCWWHSLILSILQIGLILQIIIGFLPAKVIAGLSPLALLLFSGQIAQFIWLFLPILALMFLRSRQQYYYGG